jgi:CopG family transcriptional regulator, nickel-responsive regulator
MHRITVSMDDDVRATLNALCKRRGYETRSEAIRDLVRHGGVQEQAKQDNSACFAALSYVYEHETRDLARRLTRQQHAYCDLLVATLHVHMNHDDCLEIAVLRGRVNDIRAFADTVTTQRGVRHGQLHILPSPPGGKTRVHAKQPSKEARIAKKSKP